MAPGEVARLLVGTVVHRPYVYAFLACFLGFALHQLGPRRTLAFALPTWALALLSELSSTRNGFPFGRYTYFDATRTRELWISNVPFWDSLSFVFLSYFSYVLAAAVLTPARFWRDAPVPPRGPWPGLRARATPLLGGLLMMLLDVVIDPVTLQGEKWFLGRIYAYPGDGFWFGVTAANFAGWLAVGAASQWIFQRLLARPWLGKPWRPAGLGFARAVLATYAGVLAFMLAVTAGIGDRPLLAASGLVSAATLAPLALRLRPRRAAPARIEDAAGRAAVSP